MPPRGCCKASYVRGDLRRWLASLLMMPSTAMTLAVSNPRCVANCLHSPCHHPSLARCEVIQAAPCARLRCWLAQFRDYSPQIHPSFELSFVRMRQFPYIFDCIVRYYAARGAWMGVIFLLCRLIVLGWNLNEWGSDRMELVEAFGVRHPRARQQLACAPFRNRHAPCATAHWVGSRNIRRIAGGRELSILSFWIPQGTLPTAQSFWRKRKRKGKQRFSQCFDSIAPSRRL